MNNNFFYVSIHQSKYPLKCPRSFDNFKLNCSNKLFTFCSGTKQNKRNKNPKKRRRLKQKLKFPVIFPCEIAFSSQFQF